MMDLSTVARTKNIKLRFVEEEDAEFILRLRTDPSKNKYLSQTGSDLSDQIKWIHSYKSREKSNSEYYYVICDNDNERLGLVRMYDFKDNKQSFCWGSWILKQNSPVFAGIESAITIYEIGFDICGFHKSHFDVRKDNIKVLKFHRNFGAKQIGEDDLDFYFDFTSDDYALVRSKYSKFIKMPDRI
jgi:RimJ/RimL family protein N-acetyltransferase